ncbi:uncharacterized protein LOC125596362 [Brassica napus]|uniref:uncharacterized protein LOC125596362 n=1 Tax=Brassica napus TaxID=3708 RepID=UPI00207878B9|nr:uncharacterized protein LOC125596362 [Brassica napus]
MGTQMLAFTQAFTPFVNSSVGQITPAQATVQATQRAARTARTAAGVARAAAQVARTASRTAEDRPTFAGSSDPIEADEWRSRLARNFSSTRCPEDNGTIERFSDFDVEFNHKYFPAEAWDRLESQFLNMTQGRMTVCEYKEKFNRLKRYVGKELEEEMVHIRRFVRGLRVELRTYCSVGHFQSVSELVERMALVETNLAEEAKLKSRSHTASSGSGSDRKGKRDTAEGGKASSDRPECPSCGRHHGGESWKAKGACTRCGKMGHFARDCLGRSENRGQGSGSDPRSCHYSSKTGHLR